MEELTLQVGKRPREHKEISLYRKVGLAERLGSQSESQRSLLFS